MIQIMIITPTLSFAMILYQVGVNTNITITIEFGNTNGFTNEFDFIIKLNIIKIKHLSLI